MANGDVNGDAILDLAVVGFDIDNFAVFFGQGNGNFGAPRVCVWRGLAGPRFIFLEDLTESGLSMPIVVYSQQICTFTLGTCSAPQCIFLGFTVVTAPALGDFNGDGLLDLVVARGNNLCFLFGNTRPEFFDAPRCIETSIEAMSIAAGDINNDGNLDIIIAQGDRICVLLGDGQGEFESNCFQVKSTFPSIAVGDFNLDGNLDLVIFDNDDASTCVLLGDGTGEFGTPCCF